MYKTISFRTSRALQICIVFATTLAIQELFNFPRAAWTGFAVMMIYAGFDAGSTLQRTFHRFWGAVLGLFLSYILWFIGHLDYRTLFLIVLVMVFFAFFSLGKLYAFPTIFTVTLTALGTDYYSTDTYHVAWFFSDYLICTVIALIICVVFEYFIFGKHNLTYKFYSDLQKEIIHSLEDLLQQVQQQPVSKSQWLKKTVHFNNSVLEFDTFVARTKHDYHLKDNLLSELNSFSVDLQLAYQNLRRLFMSTEPDKNTLLETRKLINDLIRLRRAVR